MVATPISPGLWRWRQEDSEFKVILGYIATWVNLGWQGFPVFSKHLLSSATCGTLPDTGDSEMKVSHCVQTRWESETYFFKKEKSQYTPANPALGWRRKHPWSQNVEQLVLPQDLWGFLKGEVNQVWKRTDIWPPIAKQVCAESCTHAVHSTPVAVPWEAYYSFLVCWWENRS